MSSGEDDDYQVFASPELCGLGHPVGYLDHQAVHEYYEVRPFWAQSVWLLP